MKQSIIFILTVIYFAAAAAAQQPELCNLAAHSGPCKALMPRYYYDPSTTQCEEFNYGGCQGNENNFMNKADCERKCIHSNDGGARHPNESSLPSLSDGPKISSNTPAVTSSGGALNSTVPVGTSSANGGPIPPVLPGAAMLGGADGTTFRRQRRQATEENGINGTLVATAAETENTVNITAGANSLIIVPPANSTITVESPGSANNSATPTTITVAEATTPPAAVAPEALPSDSSSRSMNLTELNSTTDNRAGDIPKPCLLPKMTGDCRALFQRFYYNPKSGTCEQFIWGGCDANDNNFESLADCNEACLGQRPPGAVRRAPLDRQQDSVDNFRSLEPNTAPTNVTKIYGRPTNLNTEFDAAAARLRLRQAAMNELATDAESFRDMQLLSSQPGPLPALQQQPVMEKIQREESDEENDAAIIQQQQASLTAQSSYGPMGNSNNNFAAQRQNFATAEEDGRIQTSDSLVEPAQPPLKCQLQQLTGPCDGRLKRYFFNTNNQRCEPFVYGGCYANSNNFLSQEQCIQECVAPSANRGPGPMMSAGGFSQPSRPPPPLSQPLLAAPPPSPSYYAPPPQQQQSPPQNQQYFRPLPQNSGTFERYTVPASAPAAPQPQQYYQQPPQPRPMLQQPQQQFLNGQSTFGNRATSSPQGPYQSQAIDWRADAGAQRAYRHLITRAGAPPPAQPSAGVQSRPTPGVRGTVMLRMMMPVARNTGGFEWRALPGVRNSLPRETNVNNKQMLDDAPSQALGFDMA